jgi:hypothetical protein
MKHRLAQHAGDELGHVVRLPLPAHDDALEILRAAGARKAEIVLHRDTGWNYSIAMIRDADNLADVQWVSQCARRLREQWPRVELVLLEEIALELWRDERLRALSGEQAATEWLAPLVSVKRPIERGPTRAPSTDPRGHRLAGPGVDDPDSGGPVLRHFVP